MKLAIKKDKLKENPEIFLKKNGFTFIYDRLSGKDSFVRRLGRDHYPRLHLYLMQDDDKVVFDLHFDQKKVSYEGANMHNAEYDGEIVETEIDRLKSYLPEAYIYQGKNKLEKKDKQEKISLNDFAKAENLIGKGSYEKEIEIPKKKNWFKRLLGFE